MQNNDALCSPHKLCSECKPNGNICSADNKYYAILGGIKGNILEALQVQKSICAFGQFKVFAQRVVPLFLISCAVSAHREEVNVWSASHARYITHLVCICLCKNISCNARLLWVSQEIHNGKWHIQLSVQRSALYFPHCPFLSITSQSVSNSGSLPITKASFTLGAGKVDLYINLQRTIANDHHNCQWRDNVTMKMFAIFVAGEVANNWLEDQLNGQSKGEEWLCLHIWTDQR